LPNLNGAGYLHFGRQAIATHAWLGGRLFETFYEASAGPLEVLGPGSLILRASHAGTALQHKAFLGSKAPANRDPKTMPCTIIADFEDDFYHVLELQAGGALFDFAPGGPPLKEKFWGVTAGSQWLLNRRLGRMVSPAILEAFHPVYHGPLDTRIYLNGVLDPTAATIGIDGRSVTANEEGDLVILYSPAFAVEMLGGLQIGVDLVGRMTLSFTLQEHILPGDFD
jgi:hypothetical protein